MQFFFLSLLINVWYVHCFIFVVYSYLVYLWHHLSHSLLLPKLRWIRCWSKLVMPQTRQKTNNPPVLYPCSTDTPWHKAGQLSYYRTLKQTTVHSNRHSKSLLSKVFPVIFYPNYILFTLFESFALCFLSLVLRTYYRNRQVWVVIGLSVRLSLQILKLHGNYNYNFFVIIKL